MTFTLSLGQVPYTTPIEIKRIRDYEKCMEILIGNYSNNKEKIKEKMVSLFGVLGDGNEYTIRYRKKLSRIMFS